MTANAVVAATDTDSDPVFTYGVDTIYRSVAENTAGGQNIGNAVSAIDADGDILTYTLGGTDAASFAIVSRNGQLQTKASLDYETKTSYMVTVNVSDSKDADGNADTVVDDTITVTVKVHDVHTEAPGKPNAPTVTVASTTSLNVTWTAPDNTGPAITRYTVRYCLTADNCADDMPDDWSNSDHWSNSDVTVTGATATITGLTAGASYDVQVQANNDEGAGPWSAAGAGAPTALDPIGDVLIFNVSTLTIPVEKSRSFTVKERCHPGRPCYHLEVQLRLDSHRNPVVGVFERGRLDQRRREDIDGQGRGRRDHQRPSLCGGLCAPCLPRDRGTLRDHQ